MTFFADSGSLFVHSFTVNLKLKFIYVAEIFICSDTFDCLTLHESKFLHLGKFPKINEHVLASWVPHLQNGLVKPLTKVLNNWTVASSIGHQQQQNHPQTFTMNLSYQLLQHLFV